MKLTPIPAMTACLMVSLLAISMADATVELPLLEELLHGEARARPGSRTMNVSLRHPLDRDAALARRAGGRAPR